MVVGGGDGTRAGVRADTDCAAIAQTEQHVGAGQVSEQRQQRSHVGEEAVFVLRQGGNEDCVVHKGILEALTKRKTSISGASNITDSTAAHETHSHFVGSDYGTKRL